MFRQEMVLTFRIQFEVNHLSLSHSVNLDSRDDNLNPRVFLILPNFTDFHDFSWLLKEQLFWMESISILYLVSLICHINFSPVFSSVTGNCTIFMALSFSLNLNCIMGMWWLYHLEANFSRAILRKLELLSKTQYHWVCLQISHSS